MVQQVKDFKNLNCKIDKSVPDLLEKKTITFSQN